MLVKLPNEMARQQGREGANMTSIIQDSLAIVAEKVRTGKMSRRRFMQVLAALGAAGALPAWREANAQTKEIIFSMWGGDAEEVYRKAWGAPYEEKAGVAIQFDGSGPTRGKIRAMVESKSVTWDVCDSGLGTQSSLGPEGLLEPIDYTIVEEQDRSRPRLSVGRHRLYLQFGADLGQQGIWRRGAQDLGRFLGLETLPRQTRGVEIHGRRA